jgi:hypothetical protein
VSKTELKEAIVPDFTSFALSIYNHRVAEKIVVTLRDGKENFLSFYR